MNWGLLRQVQGWVKLRGNGPSPEFIGNSGSRLHVQSTVHDAVSGLSQTIEALEAKNAAHVMLAGFAGRMTDSFGRLRVSNQFNQFDSYFPFDKQPLLWDEAITGSATSTHNANHASVDMATTTASGDQVLRQTRRRFPYQAGKGQLVKMSGCFGTAQSNNRQRLGIFDANDGPFFMRDNLVESVVIRSSVSGSPVDTSVARSSWNLDRMDGTAGANNPSGINLNLSLQQIFVIDYQWLGSGRVRFGFDVNGKIHYVHQFDFSNTISNPYSRTGMLPLRAENTNTGTAGGASTLKQTCATVISEGGFNPQGIARGINNGITTKSISATLTPVLSLRLASTAIRAALHNIEANFFVQSADDVLYEFLINPTLTGPAWTAAASGAYSEFDVTATALTGGTRIHSGYVGATSGTPGFVKESDIFVQQNTILGASIAGVADILTVAARTFTGTGDAVAGLTYREVY